jgi:hypothetical protein
MRETFILKEILTQEKIICFGGHFACHLVPVLAPNYKQHILSPAKVGKVCSSSAELYIKSVYLNLFKWKGA